MANAGSDHDAKRDLEFAGKVLSACLTLLGILIGVFGIVVGELVAAGSWKDAREEVAPFVVFLAALIALDCVVCTLALTNLAEFTRSRKLLFACVSLMLLAIAIFAIARTAQMLIL